MFTMRVAMLTAIFFFFFFFFLQKTKQTAKLQLITAQIAFYVSMFITRFKSEN